jgi:hypothetical protein
VLLVEQQLQASQLLVPLEQQRLVSQLQVQLELLVVLEH